MKIPIVAGTYQSSSSQLNTDVANFLNLPDNISNFTLTVNNNFYLLQSSNSAIYVADYQAGAIMITYWTKLSNQNDINNLNFQIYNNQMSINSAANIAKSVANSMNKIGGNQQNDEQSIFAISNQAAKTASSASTNQESISSLASRADKTDTAVDSAATVAENANSTTNSAVNQIAVVSNTADNANSAIMLAQNVKSSVNSAVNQIVAVSLKANNVDSAIMMAENNNMTANNALMTANNAITKANTLSSTQVKGTWQTKTYTDVVDAIDFIHSNFNLFDISKSPFKLSEIVNDWSSYPTILRYYINGDVGHFEFLKMGQYNVISSQFNLDLVSKSQNSINWTCPLLYRIPTNVFVFQISTDFEHAKFIVNKSNLESSVITTDDDFLFEYYDGTDANGTHKNVYMPLLNLTDYSRYSVSYNYIQTIIKKI